MAKDNAMATEGGIIVGKNAPDNLRGTTAVIQTEVRQVPATATQTTPPSN